MTSDLLFSSFWQHHLIWVVVIISIVAFLAGVMDSIAGGGGLLLLPAWMFLGMPAQTALIQNKWISSLGTLAALRNFLKNGHIWWKMACIGVPFSLLGAWLGAKVILWVDPKTALFWVLCLTPLALLISLIPKNKALSNAVLLTPWHWYALLPLCALGVGFYDGFFGPATGSLLVLLLHYALGLDLLKASANAKCFNLASNLSALLLFIWKGKIIYSLVLVPSIANIAGNHVGSHIAMQKGAGVIANALRISIGLLLVSVVLKYLV